MTLKVAVAPMLAMVLLAGSVSQAQDSNPTQLAALARDARTAGQHADVAKRYRLQAESLDAEAAQHEARAQELTRSSSAIVHKWPSMAPKALTDAKQKAMEARRAARESRGLASRHHALAVEALDVK